GAEGRITHPDIERVHTALGDATRRAAPGVVTHVGVGAKGEVAIGHTTYGPVVRVESSGLTHGPEARAVVAREVFHHRGVELGDRNLRVGMANRGEQGEEYDSDGDTAKHESPGDRVR